MKSELFDSVVIIHGIRTEATWAKMVSSTIKAEFNLEVKPLKYGFFDLFRFYFPILTRNKPYKVVLKGLRNHLRGKDDKRVLVIAHSFGTYLISEILKDNDQSDIELGGLILCGSIVDKDYPWNEKYRRVLHKVVNECGDKDIWPVIAQIATWGYGASGTTGFNGGVVQDRLHDLDHGGFFNKDFVKDYWIPLIKNWLIQDTKFEVNMPNEAPWWRGALMSVDFIIRPLVACLFLLFTYYIISTVFFCLNKWYPAFNKWYVSQIEIIQPEKPKKIIPEIAIPSFDRATKKEIFTSESQFYDEKGDGTINQLPSNVTSDGYFEFNVAASMKPDFVKKEGGYYYSMGEVKSKQHFESNLYITGNIQALTKNLTEESLDSIEIVGCDIYFILKKKGFYFWSSEQNHSSNYTKLIGVDINNLNTIAIRQEGKNVEAYVNDVFVGNFIV